MRFDYEEALPGTVDAVLAMGKLAKRVRLEPLLVELAKTRASQINHCAFCLDMHTKDAIARGEAPQRLFMLEAWREAEHLYTPREQAAIAWSEALTLVAESQVPDEVYETVRAQFSEQELMALTLVICEINTWNRICVSSRAPAGDYVPPHARAAERHMAEEAVT